MINVYYIDDEFVAACPDSVVLPDVGVLGYEEGYAFLVGVNNNSIIKCFLFMVRCIMAKVSLR